MRTDGASHDSAALTHTPCGVQSTFEWPREIWRWHSRCGRRISGSSRVPREGRFAYVAGITAGESRFRRQLSFICVLLVIYEKSRKPRLGLREEFLDRNDLATLLQHRRTVRASISAPQSRSAYGDLDAITPAHPRIETDWPAVFYFVTPKPSTCTSSI
jgi:hypothetical protein